MASINFNFFDNWFGKSPNRVPPVNMLPPLSSFSPKSSPGPNFASLSSFNPLKKREKITEPEEPGVHEQMLEQFWWENEYLPDHRHAPEVEKILNEDPVFEKKENPTAEEIEENKKMLEELRDSPVVNFMMRALEIDDHLNELEVKENRHPYRAADRKVWRQVPLVPGLDGRPMPRKAIKTDTEMENKFWDFMKEFLFGLWGFCNRPYPPGRPIDFAQAFGYKNLEKRYYDFIQKSGGYYYKDRLGRTRGPMELIQLKTAWSGGIIDKDTFMWMEDMDEWAPIHMIYSMEQIVATWEGLSGFQFP